MGRSGPATKTIRTDNGSSLVQIGSDFALRDGSGIGLALQYQGTVVTVGEFGAFTPIGAVQQSNGVYLVAWQSGTGTTAQYVVLETDSDGSYLGGATGMMSGEDFSLEDLEPAF